MRVLKNKYDPMKKKKCPYCKSKLAYNNTDIKKSSAIINTGWSKAYFEYIICPLCECEINIKLKIS